MIKAGFAEVDITPWLGMTLPGYFEDRKATGVKEPLFAKAACFEDGSNAVIIIALDTISIDRDIVLSVREKVNKATGVSGDHIMVSALHQHTGPAVIDLHWYSKDNDYIKLLVEKAADAGIMAFRRLVKARIGAGLGKEAGISFNRRYWMKNGRVRTNPGVNNPDIVNVEGPIDPDVTVLKVEDENGKLIGVLTNFACHCDCVGGTEFSADYPGIMGDTIKKIVGTDVVSVFLTGTCGNINHIDVFNRYHEEPEHYKKMGHILAYEVLRTLEKIKTSPDAKVASSFSIIKAQRIHPTPEDIEKAKYTITDPEADSFARNTAVDFLDLAAMDSGEEEIEIQAVQLGEMLIIGFPGEIFVQFGLAIKKASPYKYTMVAELTNGPCGYICTNEAYINGGYENSPTTVSRLVPGTGERMAEAAIELCKKLGNNN